MSLKIYLYDKLQYNKLQKYVAHRYLKKKKNHRVYLSKLEINYFLHTIVFCWKSVVEDRGEIMITEIKIRITSSISDCLLISVSNHPDINNNNNFSAISCTGIRFICYLLFSSSLYNK